MVQLVGMEKDTDHRVGTCEFEVIGRSPKYARLETNDFEEHALSLISVARVFSIEE